VRSGHNQWNYYFYFELQKNLRIFLEFFFTGRGSKLANAAARHNFSVKTKIGNDRSRFRFFNV